MSNLSGFVKRIRDIMRNDAGINGDAQRIEQIAWMLFLKVYDAKEQDWEFDDAAYESVIPAPCRWVNWAHDDRSGAALTGDALLDFVNNTLFPTLKKLPVDASTPIRKAIVQTTFADANQYMKDGVLLRQVINQIDKLDLSGYEESHAFNEIYETILKELQSAGSVANSIRPAPLPTSWRSESRRRSANRWQTLPVAQAALSQAGSKSCKNRCAAPPTPRNTAILSTA